MLALTHTLLSTAVAAGPGVGVALVRDLAQIVVGEADGGGGGHAVAQVHDLAGGGRVHVGGGRTEVDWEIKYGVYSLYACFHVCNKKNH